MTPAHYAKIQAGANAYLELLGDGRGKVDELLNSLRHQLGWTKAEIIALQSRVVAILLEGRETRRLQAPDFSCFSLPD